MVAASPPRVGACAAMTELGSSAALMRLVVEAVEWLPSGADSGLVRVRGRWTDSARRESGLPALGLRRRRGGTPLRLAAGRALGRDPAVWRAPYLVPSALMDPSPEALWLDGRAAREPRCHAGARLRAALDAGRTTATGRALRARSSTERCSPNGDPRRAEAAERPRPNGQRRREGGRGAGAPQRRAGAAPGGTPVRMRSRGATGPARSPDAAPAAEVASPATIDGPARRRRFRSHGRFDCRAPAIAAPAAPARPRARSRAIAAVERLRRELSDQRHRLRERGAAGRPRRRARGFRGRRSRPPAAGRALDPRARARRGAGGGGSRRSRARLPLVSRRPSRSRASPAACPADAAASPTSASPSRAPSSKPANHDLAAARAGHAATPSSSRCASAN